MLVEIVETFRKLSDGSLLHPGDVIDIPQEKALRLIEKGRARLLPSGTHGKAPSCPDHVPVQATLPEATQNGLKTGNAGHCDGCESFSPDPERGRLGLGFCQMKNHHIWITENSGCNDYQTKTMPEVPFSPEPEETALPDPVSLSERIGIRFEAEIPIPEEAEGLGKPVFTYRGEVLAWEADPPPIRVFAWATVNLFPGRPLAVDIDSTARLLEITPREVKDALARLVKEGDLARTVEKGRELYRLNVQYSEGGNHATRD